jgi:glycosyltransferase involved in cell wall biosynthesis
LRWQRRLRGAAGPAVVETFHGVGMPIRARQRWIAATLARGRDGFALMAEDPFWSGFLSRNPQLPSAVIPNGLAIDRTVDPVKAAEWRKAAGIPHDAVVIGTIGRIRAERNPLATLDAFAAAARLMPSAHFVMGGDGPMLEVVRAAAAQRGLADRLALPGLVLDPQVVLANLDLYLSMNVGAITGLAGLEAAGAGVPVIALQARDDYADGHDDWIWSERDPQLAGKELARLAGDPGACKAMAARQHARVASEFSVAAMQDAYEALYRQAIARAKA